MRKKFDNRLFNSAVHTIARQQARRRVHEQIRARGEKISQYSARESTEQAETYLAQHKDALNAKAILDCLTFPEFAPYRTELESLRMFAMMIVATEDCPSVGAKLVTNAQNQSEPNSTTSAVQISGAK